MAFFSKRLTCFYCGQRSKQPIHSAAGGVRKFHCEHCDADNFLDKNGDITDPPTSATNPEVYGPDGQMPRFESISPSESDLFCRTCTRNQHLFTASLAAYQPPSDDPSRKAEKDYDQYRRSQEERYPLVCDTCEPRVREQMKKASATAKSDWLMRFMDQTRVSKAVQRERKWSWQSMLVYIGAFFYWISICGQLVWNVMGALTPPPSPATATDVSMNWFIHSMTCVRQTWNRRQLPAECTYDLAPIAGYALVVGSLSLWYNPRLRLKVQGRIGRFKGIAEYYRVQLIVLVARCVFWSLLRNPFASGIKATLPAALHMFMIVFTLLSVVISRWVIRYEIGYHVNWSDSRWEKAWEKEPMANTETLPGQPVQPVQPVQSSQSFHPFQPSEPVPPAMKDFFQTNTWAQRALINKKSPFEQPAPPAPKTTAQGFPIFPDYPEFPKPPDSDDMDWSPSAPALDLQIFQPKVSVYQRNQPSVFDGPSPFHGNIPPAPRPPAWILRNQTPAKPIERAIEPNPFHRNSSQPQNEWPKKPSNPEPVFQPPKFFPASDHDSATGLETLFSRAFDLGATEAPKTESSQSKPRPISSATTTTRHLLLQYLRLFLLLGSVLVWTYSQNYGAFIPGNYIETCALGSASLISGFALLEAVKRPLGQWNGMEILVYITEFGAAIHLGAHLPEEHFEREYFDRYGKLLLGFMAIQEVLNLINMHRPAPKSPRKEEQRKTSPTPSHEDLPSQGAISWSPLGSPVGSPTTSESTPQQNGFSSQPPRRKSTTPLSFSSALPLVPNHGIKSSQTFGSFSSGFNNNSAGFNNNSSGFNNKSSSFNNNSAGFNNNSSGLNNNKNPHSFTMDSLKASEPLSDYEQESDSETISTEVTERTDYTNRAIRYGLNPYRESNAPNSPRRNGLGPGFGSLSLEDRPTPRRMTRSQTQQAMTPGRRFPSRVAF